MPTRRLKLAAVWLLVSAVMSWPALLNGGAIWFHDSFAYFLLPEELVRSVTGWDLRPFGEAHYLEGAPMAGRSPWYGASILLLQSWFGDLAIAILQSAILSGAVLLATRAWIGPDMKWLLTTGFVVALLTPAPFFTSYVMPDYLAGLGALAVLRILLQPAPMSRCEGVFWWGLLLFAMLSHSSHVLLVAGLLLAAPLCQLLLRQSVSRNGILGVGAALVAVICAGQLQSAAIAERYGEAELQPPFLSARLVEDGPGYRYLSEHCPQAGFELCNHLERLPLDSDLFLWEKSAETGVYQLAAPEARRRMGEEQFRFAQAVVLAYPFSQARASFGNLGEQLTRYSLREFTYNEEMRDRIARMFAGERLSSQQASRIYREQLPLVVYSDIQNAAFLLALLVAGVCLCLRFSMRFAVLGLAIGLVLLGNAAITGMLSTPHERYQARVLWLAVFFAALAWQAMLRGRAGRSTSGSIGLEQA